ncbi:MAG: hypothetical protein HND58_06280 [Planctomycetota bacterium]|nr:MAG: hypothetical protein HND58_06280 [Planctomycetota bacterium]
MPTTVNSAGAQQPPHPKPIPQPQPDRGVQPLGLVGRAHALRDLLYGRARDRRADGDPVPPRTAVLGLIAVGEPLGHQTVDHDLARRFG